MICIETELDVIHKMMSEFMERDDIMSIIDIRKIVRHMIVSTLTSASYYRNLEYTDVKQYSDVMTSGLNSRFNLFIDLREMRIVAMSAVIAHRYDDTGEIEVIHNDDGTVYRRLSAEERVSLPLIVSDIAAKVLDRTSGRSTTEQVIKAFINSYVYERTKSRSLNFAASKLVTKSDYVNQCVPIVQRVMQSYTTQSS